jgi:hypothetical protein
MRFEKGKETGTTGWIKKPQNLPTYLATIVAASASATVVVTAHHVNGDGVIVVAHDGSRGSNGLLGAARCTARQRLRGGGGRRRQ